jgi:Flp pilus assembly protein TadG
MRAPLAAQRGQAIVLIAIMLAVVVGMAALAIDGSRAYALRSDLQAALDSAALAAGDKLQQTGSYPTAEQAASTIFGTNLRLYTAPSCAPGYGTPGAAALTVTCTFSDGTILTQVVSALGPQGARFSLTATRSLPLQFARVLTNGSTSRIGATSTGGVNSLALTPTLAALDSAGCGGLGGSAITLNGGGTLSVLGDVVSNGAIRITGAAMQVAGDIYARCQATVTLASTQCYPSANATPCTFPDVAGATRAGFDFADPNYGPPALVGGAQSFPGSDVVLSPGSYGANPNFFTGCYFLSAGVYRWSAGFTNNGTFVSNELKPPDEPRIGDNTRTASHQFWDSNNSNCAGSYQLDSIASGSAIPRGSWSVVVTSVRNDTYAGTSFRRESAPSYCQTVNVTNNQALQIQVSNVPGATSYNVYAAPPGNGCTGPFGFVGNLPVAGPVLNNSTRRCPAYTGAGCSLGNESAVFDSTLITALFAPNALAAPDTFGAYPPDGETGPLKNNLPNQNADRAVPPAGDRANEDQCDNSAGGLAACPAAVTPGAVAFWIPSGACLNATASGDNYLFSGYQYNWMMLYEPGPGHPPANSCSNVMGAGSDSAWIGMTYMPSAGLQIVKAATFRTDDIGGIIADTISFAGNLPTIQFSSDYAPVPPAGRITF